MAMGQELAAMDRAIREWLHKHFPDLAPASLNITNTGGRGCPQVGLPERTRPEHHRARLQAGQPGP